MESSIGFLTIYTNKMEGKIVMVKDMHSLWLQV